MQRLIAVLLFVCLAASGGMAQQRDFNLRFWGIMNTSGSIDQPVKKISAGGNHSLALLTDSTVVAFGHDSAGQCRVPAVLRGVTAISAGYDFSLVLKKDSTITAWGNNMAGQSAVPNGLSKVTAISAGSSHSLALKADSTVVAWGDNYFGQCRVPTTLRSVVAVSAGAVFSMALKADGTVKAWGDYINRTTTIPTGLSGVIAIAAGSYHALALKANGTVVAWGDTSSGKCNVPPGLRGVVSIAAGTNYSMALKSDGTVTLWGTNWFPHWSVPVGLTSVVSIATGEDFFLSLKADGSIIGWGDNRRGQCTAPKELLKVVSVSAGDQHILALKADGKVSAWGNNSVNQCQVPINLSNVIAISAGGAHNLVLKNNGKVIAWGSNDEGQCDVPLNLSSIISVSAGYAHSLALKSDGTITAWGYNALGQCNVPPGLRGITAISAGLGFSIALKTDSTVVAWGDNGRGQCNVPIDLRGVIAISAGYSSVLALKSNGKVIAWGDSSYYLCNVPPNLRGVVGISSGGTNGISLKADGTLVGWGDNRFEQFRLIAGLQDISAIAAGGDFGVALVGPLPAQSGNRRLTGQVLEAGNGNCIRDAGEKGIAYQAIQAVPAAGGQRSQTRYGFTDTSGRFHLYVDSGRYTVSPVTSLDNQLLQRQVCPPSNAGYTASLTDSTYQVDSLNFALEQRVCPRLEVSISARRRRPCFSSQTVIVYQNSGYAAQAGVVAHLKLPRFVRLKSASVPYTFSVPDSVYHFALGTVASGGQGRILIQDSVVCNTSLTGIEQCTRAWLTPGVAPCQWPAGYDGSVVSVQGGCTLPGSRSGQVRFTLKNTGRAMSTARAYRVYQDTALAYEGSYQLASGDSLVLAFPQAPYSSTLTMEAEQDSLSPTGRWERNFASCAPLLSIGGGGTGGGNASRHGNVAAFPPSASPVESRDCQPIRNSYDPNDKQVEPRGISREGNIEPGTWLSYKIRFMNKGSDTAYIVRITDTLPEHVDLSTLRLGASSHLYTPKLSGRGRPVLTFEMAAINLPDSGRSGSDKAAGFVSFRIRTDKAAPLGTRIENKASIYFDFNPAVVTNTTQNTLYRPLITPHLIDSVRIITASKTRQSATGSMFSVEPNPGAGRVVVKSSSLGTLEVYGADGKAMLYPISKGATELDFSRLARGLYLLRLNGAGTRWVKE